VLKRILSGAGANAYAQFVTIIIQLGSLPILLTVWDLETYGIWLVISTIPVYISLSDVGMVTATGNRLNMLLTRGLKEKANTVFQSTLVFLFLACMLILVVLALLVQIVTMPVETRLPLFLLCISAFISLFGGLAGAIYKATFRYALSIFISSNIRLLEWLGLLLGLWYGGSYLSVAIGILIARFTGTVFFIVYSRGDHGIQWGIASFKWSEVLLTIKPAIAFMSFPIANALNIQCVTLVVASTLGPSTLAIFNAYRTVARVTVQATSIVSHALWPEFTRLYVSDPSGKLVKLYKNMFWLGSAIALVICIIVYLFSPYVLKYWSNGKIEFISLLMAAMMLYAFICSVWHVSRILMMSTSQHIRLAIWSSCIASLTVILTYIVALIYKSSLGVSIVLAFCESLMAIYAIFSSRNLLKSKD